MPNFLAIWFSPSTVRYTNVHLSSDPVGRYFANNQPFRVDESQLWCFLDTLEDSSHKSTIGLSVTFLLSSVPIPDYFLELPQVSDRTDSEFKLWFVEAVETKDRLTATTQPLQSCNNFIGMSQDPEHPFDLLAFVDTSWFTEIISIAPENMFKLLSADEKLS